MVRKYRSQNAVTREQDKHRIPTKILNPFYDPVCKFLMQDNDCARLLLGKILQEKILSLTLLAEEVPIKIKPSKKAAAILAKIGVKLPKNQFYRCLRLDFKAEIHTPQSSKMILIEIQKVYTTADIPRFRTYLGTQYLNNQDDDQHLPLIAIYLLGTKLPESLTQSAFQVPILHRGFSTQDVLKQQTIREESPTMDRLTHEIYILQAPYLSPTPKSALEKALLIFNPHYVARNPHFLTLQERDLTKEYAILWKCLARAAAEPEVEKAMQAVDEYVETFDAYADEIIKYHRELAKAKADKAAKARMAAKYQAKYQAEVKAYKQKLARIKQERLKAEQERLKAEQERLKAEQEQEKEKAAYKQRIKELEELLQHQKSQ